MRSTAAEKGTGRVRPAAAASVLSHLRDHGIVLKALHFVDVLVGLEKIARRLLSEVLKS